MYVINGSNSFKKDYKFIKKRNYDLFLLKEVLGELMTKGKLDTHVTQKGFRKISF
jgi:mRNA-degrading endonuclease YafQ of YafQ-DinJ toxin-antitoxin module